MKNGRRWVFYSVLMILLSATGLCAAQEITVSTVQELINAVDQANAGQATTIYLNDGTYTLDNPLTVSASGVTIAGLSGDRSAVVIQGQGGNQNDWPSHVFAVSGSNFTLTGVSLGNVGNHAIQIHGELDADNLTVMNCRFFDTGEQMLKGSYDQNNPANGSDNGRIENCLFEYTSGYGPQWYIGGIDVHNGAGWVVRGNTFRYIRSPSESVAEFAIHFWSDSSGTLVEKNLILTCDRGIGFGLGDRGHTNGIIRNNMIYHDASEDFADVGIAVETAPGVQIYNNTVYQEHSYSNAIEYRWPATTGGLVANNLTNRAVVARDGAVLDASYNVETAQAGWFVGVASGNLHLASAQAEVVDQGRAIDGLFEDYDSQTRPQGAGIDIGADEYCPDCPTDPVGGLGSVVKLIFIHHSTGENWLADENGGLGLALGQAGFFVSDTNYGWGPGGIGDITDIGHWWNWFRGPDSPTYLAALYAESDSCYDDWEYYTRPLADPGGENTVVMFKSCFPNSALGGGPNDPPTTGQNELRGGDAWSDYFTVANAKGIYNDILEYFATRPDKMFVVITAPPLMASATNDSQSTNVRAFNNWLVRDWLANYTGRNVFVFDFYNILTSNGGDQWTTDLGWETGNHHRYRNGAFQHIQTFNGNVSAYPTEDSHPNQVGNQKATAEYVDFLTACYLCWQGRGGCPSY